MIGAFLCTLLMGAWTSPVHACTPTPVGRPSYTFADKVKAAPIILEGVVTDVDSASFYNTATVAVSRYFKGTGTATVTIGHFGSSAVCLVSVTKGQHAIFYATETSDKKLDAFYMSAGAAIDSVNQADAIIAITGQQPTLPTDLSNPASSGGSSIGTLAGLSIILVIGLLVYLLLQ